VYNINLVFAHQPPDNGSLHLLGVEVAEQAYSRCAYAWRQKSAALVKQSVYLSVGHEVHSIALFWKQRCEFCLGARVHH
jgi:hypothetical protein